MKTYSLKHLSDDALLNIAPQLVSRERMATADLLAHIAEIDERRLYLPRGYASMHAYCVDELGLSEDAASRRIRVARLAREYPQIFTAIAEGRLHLSAVIQLGCSLTPERGHELLIAASGKSKREIEELLARRLPQSESIPLVEAVQEPVVNFLPAPAPVENWPAIPRSSSRVAPSTRVVEIAPRRFDLRVTIGESTRNKLQYAHDLLGHAVRLGDLAAVFDRALDALIAKLEKQKFAATDRPRQSRESTRARQVPARVKRTVWQRDAGQCTFISESGHRCAERRRLEYDHIVPVARGGEATLDNLRLRCRAHNQYEADRTFGRDFMESKREEARRRAGEKAEEVIPWLRQLGFKTDEARRAADQCLSIPDAPLEERITCALKGWLPRGTTKMSARSSA